MTWINAEQQFYDGWRDLKTPLRDIEYIHKRDKYISYINKINNYPLYTLEHRQKFKDMSMDELITYFEKPSLKSNKKSKRKGK